MLSSYYDADAIAAAVKDGKHREAIGGLWDEIGQLQFDFMMQMGLQPMHRFLDIGCGSLRAGVKLVRYLDAGNYFGTDLNEPFLKAGYDIEIAKDGLTERLPRTNLIADGEFDFTWVAQPFDYAIAQSLFTHLPLNHIRICLERLAGAMRTGGRFYMTFFEIPESHPSHQPFRHERGDITSRGGADPYHYRASDLQSAAAGLPWRFRYIGDWSHPRSQRMVEFVRTS